jgi:transcriptional regulator with XRE-family HTH domain
LLITPDQTRAARALLRMDQEELARRASVSAVTVRRLEADGLSRVGAGTIDEVQRALEAAGAEFVERGAAAEFKDAPPFTEDDLYDENGLPA